MKRFRFKYETYSKRPGHTEIRTRIAGFKVRSAHHYAIGPHRLIPNKATFSTASVDNLSVINLFINADQFGPELLSNYQYIMVHNTWQLSNKNEN